MLHVVQTQRCKARRALCHGTWEQLISWLVCEALLATARLQKIVTEHGEHRVLAWERLEVSTKVFNYPPAVTAQLPGIVMKDYSTDECFLP